MVKAPQFTVCSCAIQTVWIIHSGRQALALDESSTTNTIVNDNNGSNSGSGSSSTNYIWTWTYITLGRKFQWEYSEFFMLENGFIAVDAYYMEYDFEHFEDFVPYDVLWKWKEFVYRCSGWNRSKQQRKKKHTAKIHRRHEYFMAIQQSIFCMSSIRGKRKPNVNHKHADVVIFV